MLMLLRFPHCARRRWPPPATNPIRLGLRGGKLLFAGFSIGLALPAHAWEVATTRPRLFLRADAATIGCGPTRSEMRARWDHPTLQAYAKQVTDGASWESQLTPALQTFLGRDPAAEPQVRTWLLEQRSAPRHSTARQGAGHMAVAFDWICDGLTSDERRQAAENVRTGADAALAFLRVGEPDINHNFTYMALFSVTMAGLALHGEPGFETVAAAYLEEARDWLEGTGGAYEAAAARGGAWPEGGQYSFTECTRLLVLTMHGLRTATRTDPFVLARSRYGDFLRGTARFYMALTRPDLTLERLGDVNQFKPLVRDQHRFVIEALAAGLRGDGGDARVSAMLEHFADRLHAAYGWRDTHRNYAWGMLLFADPEAPRDAAAYAAQPLLQLFGRGTLDLVVIRHGWDENGTAITFQAGDHFVDHQHFDKGAFTIYHRGALAIDAGAYDRMYSPHHTQYACRTVAHNAPLVFDPEQPVPGDFRRDGGQRVVRDCQHHARWTDFVAHRHTEHLDAATLLCAEGGSAAALAESSTAPFNRYAVAAAELAGAYGPAVESLRRTLAFFPAAQLLLVDDALQASSPFDAAFVLHTIEPPLAAGIPGAAAGRAELGNVDWWVATRHGTLDLGEREVLYDGRLFLRTVSPRPHRAVRIGGTGYEFWVNGVNYKPAGGAGAPREAGAWRLELHPQKPAARQQWTHAILVSDPSQVRPPAAAPLSPGSGWHGAHAAGAPEAVLLVAEHENAALPLQYALSTSLPCIHVLVGLAPGDAFEVTSGGAARTLLASAEGVLAFYNPAIGPHAVRVARAAVR